MTIRVVGLDLSTRSTGYTDPAGGMHTIRPASKDRDRRLNEIRVLLDPYLRLAKPDVAVIESPVSARGGQQTFRILAELAGVVRERLFEYDCQTVEIAPGQLKKLACGNGGKATTKDHMVDAVVECGGHPRNEDEADSWWCWAAGRMWFDRWEPVFRREELRVVRREVLAGLRWPALKLTEA